MQSIILLKASTSSQEKEDLLKKPFSSSSSHIPGGTGSVCLQKDVLPVGEIHMLRHNTSPGQPQGFGIRAAFWAARLEHGAEGIRICQYQ